MTLTKDLTPSLIIHTDGGARGNPGPAASAFVVLDRNRQVLFQKGIFLGKTTNNFAEYSAVVFSLEWLLKAEDLPPIKHVMFNIDSQLVVNQLNGVFKIKSGEIRQMIFKIKTFENQLKYFVSYRHVPRRQNVIADALVNKTLDRETLLHSY